MRKKAAVIGVLDGVHEGHRYLLRQLKDIAAGRGLDPVAVTFSRHPLTLVRPEAVPPQICPLPERLELIRREGVEPLLLDFTPELRLMTARKFLEGLKGRGFDLLLMGFNNRIGLDRLSGPELAGGPVEVLTATELPERGICSSEIRAAVSSGNMELAAKMLGRPFALEGEVVGGRRVGRTIGFPTANVSVEPGQLMPPNGVYAACAAGHRAVVNIGRRPTLDNGEDVTVEAHLLDFSGDLYGRTLRVEFLRRLRPEMKFASLDQLKSRIQQDIDSVRDGK
ncbi:MAG: riboflavin biosynthesis protein RibF [Muribaculaceae bacterium]|nr:riboflavin biosynthesis protein RibF [Muribaculaceae bacterium]